MKTNKKDKLARLAERRRVAEALAAGKTLVTEWNARGERIERLMPATPIQLALAERPTYGGVQNLTHAARLEAARASNRKSGKGKR